MTKSLYEIYTVDGLRGISDQDVPAAIVANTPISLDFGLRDPWEVPAKAVARYRLASEESDIVRPAQWAEDQGWPEFQRLADRQT